MRSDARDGVSIILPAYEEEEAVAAQVESVGRLAETLGRSYEIIVVDDGSEDRTGERATAAGARVIRHAQNRGYGAAVKTGIDAASYESIVMIDADGTYPVEAIPRLLGRLDRADMVVGARTGERVHIPLVRRPAKFVLRWLAARIGGTRIPDLNSGLRCFRRETVRQYYSILPDQFSFTTTITLALLADGYRVVYEPIDYHPRVGRSKIRPWHFLDFTILVLRLAMLFQPLKVFVPLALGTGLLAVLKVGFDVVAFIPRNEAFGWSVLYQAVLSGSALFLLLITVQLLLVGMVADGLLRRIAQRGDALVPSRATWVVEGSLPASNEASVPRAAASEGASAPARERETRGSGVGRSTESELGEEML